MIDKDSFSFLRAATSGVARGFASEGTFLMELLLVILSFIAYCDKQLIFIDLFGMFICFLSIQNYR